MKCVYLKIRMKLTSCAVLLPSLLVHISAPCKSASLVCVSTNSKLNYYMSSAIAVRKVLPTTALLLVAPTPASCTIAQAQLNYATANFA